MSRPKYWWYGTVVSAIRHYPVLEKAKAERKLPPKEEDIIRAVRLAVEEFEKTGEGQEVLEVVKLYHWQKAYDFETVGYKLHMSARNAGRCSSRFVYAVARNLGYMEKLA